jgi:SIT4 phosphatase-associated protein
MNPYVDEEVQGNVADVLKAIIQLSADKGDPCLIGPNSLARELASEARISQLLDYMLDPVAPHSTASLTNGISLIIELIRKNEVTNWYLLPTLS